MVGRIVRPHGIRGEVVVDPASDEPGRFAAGSVLLVGDPDGAPEPRRVESSRPHQRRVLLRFDGVPDRTTAETLRGALLSIDAADAPPPPAGRYYAHDIEGLRVVDEQGRELGVVTSVLENPANDLWVVDHDGREVMLPAVREIVIAVDVSAGRVVVRAIPGLFD